MWAGNSRLHVTKKKKKKKIQNQNHSPYGHLSISRWLFASRCGLGLIEITLDAIFNCELCNRTCKKHTTAYARARNQTAPFFSCTVTNEMLISLSPWFLCRKSLQRFFSAFYTTRLTFQCACFCFCFCYFIGSLQQHRLHSCLPSNCFACVWETSKINLLVLTIRLLLFFLLS